MKNVKVEDTRNFAIVGHAGDGKTSLGEALLHGAGATQTLGSVTEGSSVLNHLPRVSVAVSWMAANSFSISSFCCCQ